MSKVRVCFLGTPEFAAVSLKEILNDEHFEVVGVVTQPDRPAGRKLILTPSPVKELALQYGLKVLSPESLKDNVIICDAIKSWGAEVAVVVAFGQILTQEFMDSFTFGAVNIHGSLLPRWRGAAPIQRAIQYGDRETGVALQRMVKKLDAGDVLGVRKMEIPIDMTAMELHDKLAFLGADLLRVELMDFLRGHLVGVKQDEALVTVAKKIDKLESEVKWSLKAIEIHNQIRALTMGPGSFTWLEGKKIKIHRTRLATTFQGDTNWNIKTQADLNNYLLDYQRRKKSEVSEAGKIISITEEALTVKCGDGNLEILELQPESRNRMKIKDFLSGSSLKVGDRFL
ncbi:MAG: methionyl-tRNA formyltransferase [Bdellovibrionaceae bacterium]|nr:methionyl-tRNA formyltransferase [Pseudobdellovibrionaceae bacterium]NUM59633.1 methionyl-tRNA formyltransferase [Pseudobdellovibrionaceae bacterium]